MESPARRFLINKLAHERDGIIADSFYNHGMLIRDEIQLFIGKMPDTYNKCESMGEHERSELPWHAACKIMTIRVFVLLVLMGKGYVTVDMTGGRKRQEMTLA